VVPAARSARRPAAARTGGHQRQSYQAPRDEPAAASPHRSSADREAESRVPFGRWTFSYIYPFLLPHNAICQPFVCGPFFHAAWTRGETVTSCRQRAAAGLLLPPMMDYRTDYRREPADYRRVINENSAPEALRDYRRDGVATSGDGVALSTTTAIVSCAAISVAAFGYCLAQGATGPCVAELLLERACLSHNLTYPSKACTSSVTSQDTASRRLSYYNLCCQLPALMTVAGVAMIADSRGRKVAALVPYTGSMLATLALAVLPAAAPVCVGGTCVDSFTALLCTTAIASASGGYFSVLAFSFAVIGDATERASSPKLRTYLFAVLETALMVGFFAGPAIGGELGPLLGLQHSLFVPVACYLVGLVTILCLMTETLEQEKRATFSWAKANPFGAMAMLLDNRIATTLASCVLLSNMAGGAGTVLPLYLAQTLGYDSVQTGWFTASGQAGAAVGLLVVLPALQRCISTKAIVVISVGMSVLSGFGGGLVRSVS
jgi:hypothetical protein